MEKDIIDYVKSNGRKKYYLTYKDGHKETATLDYFAFYNSVGKKKGRKWYIFDEAIATIKVAKTKTPIEWFRHNNARLIKCLSESGLWADILEWAKTMESLTDEEIEHYDTNNTPKGFIGVDAFSTMFTNKSIKAVNYDRRWSFESMVREAIEKRETYHTPRWYKGYDNSVGVQCDEKDDKIYPRGWYSEEYKGTGNGYYYLLIDSRHAIFCEKD